MRLLMNDHVDALMTATFICIVVVILADSIRGWLRTLIGGQVDPGKEQVAA